MVKKISFLSFFLAAVVALSAQVGANHEDKADKDVRVQIETTHGKIVVKLYNDTPKHRDNFLKLVKDGTYNGLLFHRVIKNFMIQGGDPNSRNAKAGQALGDGTLGYTVPAEFVAGRYHKRGALCAARQGDAVNPKKESSASQFYIVQGQVWTEEQLSMMEQRMGKKFGEAQRKAYTTVGGTPFLDGDYTVFGEVVEGMDVVDRIASVKCGSMDRPEVDVRILKVKVLK